jgi:integrase
LAGSTQRKRPSKDGLYLRGSIWWANIRGERVSTHCKDRPAARIARARLEREAADPRNAAARKTTVGDMIEHVLEDRKRAKGRLGRNTQHTLDIYERTLGHVSRILGRDTPIFDIDYEAVGRYISKREGEYHVSPHTISKELLSLRFGLRLEQANGCYPHSVDHVTRKGRFSADHTPRSRFLTWEEIPALLTSLMAGLPVRVTNKPRKGSLPRARHVAWLIATACRLGESYRAQPEDLDRQRWILHIRGTKSKNALRDIPIAAPFRALASFAVEDAKPGRPMFKAWGNIYRGLALACARAGILPVTPNDLRRTHASLLRQAGVSLDNLAPVMGHADTKLLFSTYGRTTPEALSNALESVPVTPHSLLASSTILTQPTENTQKDRGKA